MKQDETTQLDVKEEPNHTIEDLPEYTQLHQGPGPHAGTGTDQSAHGSGGGGKTPLAGKVTNAATATQVFTKAFRGHRTRQRREPDGNTLIRITSKDVDKAIVDTTNILGKMGFGKSNKGVGAGKAFFEHLGGKNVAAWMSVDEVSDINLKFVSW